MFKLVFFDCLLQCLRLKLAMVGRICSAETAAVFPGIIARNKAVLEYEKFVHHTFYSYIIHPYSRFRVYWEIVLLVIIPFRMFIVTVLWILLPRTSFAYAAVLAFFQVINVIDVVLRFLTGYVEPKTDIVILEPKKIVVNYLLKFFIFDIVPCIPVSLILYYHPESGKNEEGKASFLYYVMYIVNTLLVLRTFTFFLYLYHTSNLFLWYPFLLGLICMPLLIFFFYLLFVNAMFFHVFSRFGKSELNQLEEMTIMDRFQLFLFMTDLLVEYLSSSCNTKSTHFKWRFPFLLIIFFCSIFFIVYLTKFCLLKMNKKEKFLDLESRILSFARKRHLSYPLTQKILLYFLILIENKYCKEDEIFLYIPNTFKSEIFFHLCLPLLKNFYAFENLPTYALRRLAECMTYQLYLPNEIVMSRVEPTLRMYFILRGTLALYSAQHVELYHFGAGSSINGKNFVLGDLNHSHYAISIEVTEVYRLDYVNYIEIMAAYPKLLRNIQRKFHQNKSELSILDFSPSWE